ncbi:hypothetical protein [Mycoplasma parvum]|nr:hypothetical protein [Mycoplasma parvum]
MGLFGFKKTFLNVEGRKVTVGESTVTFSPNDQNPFKEWKENEQQKDKKFVIFGLCLNGEFRPEILEKWEQIPVDGRSKVIREAIRGGLKEIDEMLRKSINKWVGCQESDLVDESGKVGVGFLEQIFVANENGGGSGLINWKLKNEERSSINITANYINECKRSTKKGMVCKIEPQFANSDKNIKGEVKREIEKRLEDAIEKLVDWWLNNGHWENKKFCHFLSNSINKSFNKIKTCLQPGEMGGSDTNLPQDIKKIVTDLKSTGNINFEIGEWWLSGRWKKKPNEKWGRKDGQHDVRGVTEKLIEFAGSIGRLEEQTAKYAVKELIEKFEERIINQNKDFCGIWNEGASCPEGGVVIYKK